jgi:hypothetical protein
MNPRKNQLSSSYRDPAGFVFEENGIIYRQVNQCYRLHYNHLIASGLYEKLTSQKLLIAHEEITDTENKEAYKILKPDRIPFISQAENWCHSQLRDAAILTLKIQKISLQYGMALKDATPKNIQFIGCRPVFIDTLSFEKIVTQKPWVAYRQFCESFLAPLSISHYTTIPTNRILLGWPAGIGLRTTRKLLPLNSYLNIDITLNIHLQSAIIRDGQRQQKKQLTFSEKKHIDLISSLQRAVETCKVANKSEHWAHYYEEVATRANYMEEKERIIRSWMEEFPMFKTGLDLGSNTGHFTKILAEKCSFTIAVDNSEASIEGLFSEVKGDSFNYHEHILPLVLDLSNTNFTDSPPSSGILSSGPYEIVLALAIIHHLIIRNNIPSEYCIERLSKLTKNTLLLEFIPADDPLALRMREDKDHVYHEYEQSTTEKHMERFFHIEERIEIGSSGRFMYRLRKK